MSIEDNIENVASEQTGSNRKKIIIGGVALLVLILIIVITLVVVYSSCPGGNWFACTVRQFRRNIPSDWYSETDASKITAVNPTVKATLEACASCDPLPIYFPGGDDFSNAKMLNEAGYKALIDLIIQRAEGHMVHFPAADWDSFGEFSYYTSERSAAYWYETGTDLDMTDASLFS